MFGLGCCFEFDLLRLDLCLLALDCLRWCLCLFACLWFFVWGVLVLSCGVRLLVWLGFDLWCFFGLVWVLVVFVDCCAFACFGLVLEVWVGYGVSGWFSIGCGLGCLHWFAVVKLFVADYLLSRL